MILYSKTCRNEIMKYLLYIVLLFSCFTSIADGRTHFHFRFFEKKIQIPNHFELRNFVSDGKAIQANFISIEALVPDLKMRFISLFKNSDSVEEFVKMNSKFELEKETKTFCDFKSYSFRSVRHISTLIWNASDPTAYIMIQEEIEDGETIQAHKSPYVDSVIKSICHK